MNVLNTPVEGTSLIEAFTVSLLNIHESARTTTASWVVVAWIPIYDSKKCKRTQAGADGYSARIIRLYHDCWKLLLERWNERTLLAIVLYWAGGIRRLTRFFVGGIIVDQQEADKVAGNTYLFF